MEISGWPSGLGSLVVIRKCNGVGPRSNHSGNEMVGGKGYCFPSRAVGCCTVQEELRRCACQQPYVDGFFVGPLGEV